VTFADGKFIFIQGSNIQNHQAFLDGVIESFFQAIFFQKGSGFTLVLLPCID
jgi:hypothetical protein